MNNLQIIKETPTKKNMSEFVEKYLTDKKISPLQKFLNLKAIEYMIKIALTDKDFRTAVKEDYIKQTEGSISKTQILGVEIKTASQEKKNTLAKNYIYSENIEKLEKEIELLEQELKLKKDTLKGSKLLEINSGIAIEVTSGIQTESNVLDSFNLVVTFKDS